MAGCPLPAKPNTGAYHICVLYDNAASLSRSCAVLVHESILAGYTWVSVVENITSSRLSADINPVALARGNILNAEKFLNNTTFNEFILLLIEALRNFVKQAREDGYVGLLILLDMSHALTVSSEPQSHAKLEAALHYLSSSSPVRIACFYDDTHPAEALLDVLCSHTEIFQGNEIFRNPHFLPPALSLFGDARRKLDWWLEKLSDFAGPSCRVSLSKDADGVTDKQRFSTRKAFIAKTIKPWKVNCLGPLRVYRNGDSLIEWNGCKGATNKVKTIFAYLLQKEGKGGAIEELMDLLWPDARNLKQGRNRLYHAVHCLKNLLARNTTTESFDQLIICQDGRYYLRLPPSTRIDVRDFNESYRQGEKLFKNGDIRQSLIYFEVAERLYCGEMFSDIPSRYVENRELDWCWSQRRTAEERYLTVLTYMASINRQQGHKNIGLSCCVRVLERDPCNEPAHREAMRIYHLIGCNDAVARQYKLCCESLAQIEDRRPSRRTLTLFQELTKQEK